MTQGHSDSSYTAAAAGGTGQRTVQPHGLVLVIRAADLRVEWMSANAPALLGVPIDQLAGQPLTEVMPSATARVVLRGVGPEPGLLGHLELGRSGAERRFFGTAHRAGCWIIMECESIAAPEAELDGAHPSVEPAEWIRSLQSATNVEAAARAAALELRKLTGYDRVTVRQFDTDFNAAVIAEARSPDLDESHVGLHFSALDTPRQARDLLRTSHVRLIVDVEDVEVPLVGPSPVDESLDLCRSVLRTVSLRHRDYLRNSGARSVLLLPLLFDTHLWGMVVCHHRKARWVSPEVRAAAEERAQVLAMRLAALEAEGLRRQRERLQAERRRIWIVLEQGPDDFFGALSKLGRTLRAALEADGLALVLEDRLTLVGRAPDAAAVRRLAGWLDRHAEGDFFHTDRLAHEFPDAVELHETAAGLVAIRLTEAQGGWLLGFRPAVFGRRAEPPPVPASSAELSAPSAADSFAAWRHWMQLRSRPWEPVELESALALTRLKRMADARKREQQRRQALRLEALSELSSGVAHHFNNATTALLGLISLAAKTLPEEHDARDYLARAQTTLGHGVKVVQQLLAFTRKQAARPRVVDLNDLLAGAQARLRAMLPPNVELEVRPGPNLGLVRADPLFLDQIVDQLVANARDAMADGGRVVLATGNAELSSSHVEVSPGLRPGPFVALTVADTGLGMTEAVQERVFEPFFTTKNIGDGVGLGLSICFGMIKQSGGHIEVHSRPERGTTFTVFLPRIVFEASERPRLERARQRGRVVLVVDDESLVRFVAVETLQELGHEVLSADSGESALALMEERESQHLDLVITDIVMPRISGPALVELLRGRYPELRAIYTTGYSTDTVAGAVRLDERSQILQKPFMPDDLEQKVRETLE